MKYCEFNFTMKAVYCIDHELKGQTKYVKGTDSKEISCPQYVVLFFSITLLVSIFVVSKAAMNNLYFCLFKC